MPMLHGTDISLRDYWEIIVRRKKIVIFFFAITVILALVFSYNGETTYESVTKVAIQTNFMEVQPIAGPKILNVEPSIGMSKLFLNTQYEIIMSRLVLEKAVYILGWDKTEDTDSAIVRLKRLTRVEPLTSGNVIGIFARSSVPRVAMDMANAVAQAYIDLKKEDRQKLIRDIYTALEEQARQAKFKLDESEKELEKFKKQYSIIELEGKDISEKTMSDINDKLIVLKTQIIENETLLNTLNDLYDKDSLSALTLVSERIGSVYPINTHLKDIYFSKENNLNNLIQKFRDKHPLVMEARSDLESIKNEIKAEVKRAMDSLVADIGTKKNIQTTLLSYIENPAYSEKQTKYLDLKQKTDTNRELYNTLLKTLKDTDINEKLMQSPDARIIEPAHLPTSPVPGRKLGVILSPILGLILGVTVSLMLAYLDNTIKTIEDVEKFLNLPVLGVIPRMRVIRRDKNEKR